MEPSLVSQFEIVDHCDLQGHRASGTLRKGSLGICSAVHEEIVSIRADAHFAYATCRSSEERSWGLQALFIVKVRNGNAMLQVGRLAEIVMKDCYCQEVNQQP